MQELLKPQKHWKLSTYGDIFSFLSTANYSRSELTDNGEIGYVHYGDIHTKLNFFLDAGTFNFPTVNEPQAKPFHELKDGDIIMADASEDYPGVGKSVEVKNVKNRRIICGLHTYFMRDERNVLINGFRGYLHSSIFIKKQLDTYATGLKVYSISKNNLKQVIVPIPPIDEQLIITETLIGLDNEISLLEEKLSKCRMIKHGMLQTLLTGKIRLI